MFHRSLIFGLVLSVSANLWASDLDLPSPNPRLSLAPVLILAEADQKKDLSLEDLGFSQDQTKGDAKFQKDLETRSDMLKIHQTLGLITCVPMVTTYVLGFTAAKDDLLLHGGMGFTTAGLYATTASFAVFAPHVEGVKAKGNSELHQTLAVLHGFFMVATPILGELAEGDKSLVDLHFISATGLVATFLSAMAVMTF